MIYNQQTSEIDILLIEDSESDAEITIRSLKKNNLTDKLFWIKDGEEAVDFLNREGSYDSVPDECLPKLILLDIKLPKINGFEILKLIKSNSQTRRIPVVMLTSSREDRDVIQSYDLGANSYVVKPVEYENFKQAVKEIGLYWLVSNENSI
ncbi:MAG: response regulator [Bacteroidota bacterium]